MVGTPAHDKQGSAHHAADMSTENDETPDSVEHVGFLDLPREIRSRIYEHALPPLIMEIRGSLARESLPSPVDFWERSSFQRFPEDDFSRLTPATAARLLEQNEQLPFAHIRYTMQPMPTTWLSLLRTCKAVHADLIDWPQTAPIEVQAPDCDIGCYHPQSLFGVPNKHRVVAIDFSEIGFAAESHRVGEWMDILLPLFPNLEYLGICEWLEDGVSMDTIEWRWYYRRTWRRSLRMMKKVIQSSGRQVKRVMSTRFSKWWGANLNFYEFVARPSQAGRFKIPPHPDHWEVYPCDCDECTEGIEEPAQVNLTEDIDEDSVSDNDQDSDEDFDSDDDQYTDADGHSNEQMDESMAEQTDGLTLQDGGQAPDNSGTRPS